MSFFVEIEKKSQEEIECWFHDSCKLFPGQQLKTTCPQPTSCCFVLACWGEAEIAWIYLSTLNLNLFIYSSSEKKTHFSHKLWDLFFLPDWKGNNNSY